MPIYQLDTYANTILAQSLSTVSGVGQVDIAGQQLPAIHVQVDPQALAAHGLSLAQVQSALSAATLDAPKGNLEGPHQQFPLDTNDQLLSADQFGNIILAYQNGAPVTVKDIGDVINSSVNPRTGAWFDGKRAELLLIKRESAPTPSRWWIRSRRCCPRCSPRSRAVHVDLVSDRSQNIRASVRDVEMTLLITVVLVVLIIFAFFARRGRRRFRA